MKKTIFAALPPLALAAVSCQSPAVKSQQPNVLLIVADDLGMGDLSAYGAHHIHTPNIDRLAQEGVCVQNAYATSATSTPSRYAMFTGLYPWKNKVAKILPGDAPLLIPTDIPTMPKMFQQEGYNTAAIGKWHLGMGNGNVDWNQEIVPSGNTVGFDYTKLIAATNDRVPTVFVRNGRVVGLDPDDPIEIRYGKPFEGEPTAITNPELMTKMKWHHGHNCTVVNGIPRIGYMKGGEKAKWVDEDMADYFVGEVKAFLDQQTADQPFFLYYGLHEPHVPRAPHARFVGSTDLGPRGDAVVEADWCVGEVIQYLEEKGMLENTLVIFTSDNGPVINDGYYDDADVKLADHDPRAGTRGGKYSLYDGGTHIPLITYWKGHIQPGISEAMVSQLDFFASMAEFIGTEAPEGLDSRNHLDAFLGRADEARESMVLEAQQCLSYREGNYQLIPPYQRPERNITQNELGGSTDTWTLYDLSQDRGQLHDIAAEHPEIVERMKKAFLEKTEGYFTLGVQEEKLK